MKEEERRQNTVFYASLSVAVDGFLARCQEQSQKPARERGDARHVQSSWLESMTQQALKSDQRFLGCQTVK